MSTTDILGKDRDDDAITPDVVVIGGLTKASVTSRDEAFDREWTVRARGATVNDEQFDCGVMEFFHLLDRVMDKDIVTY